jgi:large subunit ribosomal protein L6
MSRVGRKPISIPQKTTLTYKDRVLTVQGEKGALTRAINSAVDLQIKDGIVEVIIISNDKRPI